MAYSNFVQSCTYLESGKSFSMEQVYTNHIQEKDPCGKNVIHEYIKDFTTVQTLASCSTARKRETSPWLVIVYTNVKINYTFVAPGGGGGGKGQAIVHGLRINVHLHGGLKFVLGWSGLGELYA